ncbi:MAG: hypothetical protein KH377_08545 [[Eubacterium] siraeum]|nr:hypothetical protein [[Eubacterium] siraeum]
MRKSLAVLIAVIIAAMLCGCTDDVSSSVQQEDSSSRSSTKWTVTKVADDDISCEGLVLTALNSGDFPEMVKATDSTLLDTIMDFRQFGTYPEQEKIVSRTVVFQKGDLCFLIASEEPEKAEKAISDKISANSVDSGD